ncbi:hypothetical protein Q4E93_09310 [Flavitalea sp. BT771]|uniref:hypothetical protein n=1 Tax=Flavitalea sp. BT771 TaxID=3063329 RepID=UPI0026E174E7|nr:hypothetical protein [Flavitalea sp. BT771]MDO6430786.1 hypothetical protein [Flavitalea sp. BT771]MDV6219074.1 hypothetical protein [Flavitalea sp. BT771]
MEKMLLLALYTSCILPHLSAQSSRIEYRTIVKLTPAEQINNLLTCWKPNEKAAPSLIVIQQSNGTFSIISDNTRKDNLTREQVSASFICPNTDPNKVPKESYTGYSKLLANGAYSKVLFMRESGNRFVAVVADDKKQFFFINSEGQKTLLDGKPDNLITNQDVSRAAVVLADKQATPMEEVNKMSHDQQIAFFEKMRTTDLTRKVWLSDNKTFTVLKKSRLSFDVSGRHFIEIQPKTFYIDGVPCQKDISGGGTQLFVSPDGKDWAYCYMIYLSFKNNTNLQNVFNPFITIEDGKEYLNWFIVQKENNSTLLKHGKRQW